MMEVGGMVGVNKHDGELAAAARTAAANYGSALRLVRSKTTGWTPRVVLVSALEGTGIDELWATVEEFRAALGATGELGRRRAEQAREWMWSEVHESLMDSLRHDEHVSGIVEQLEAAVTEGELPPAAPPRRILPPSRRRPPSDRGAVPRARRSSAAGAVPEGRPNRRSARGAGPRDDCYGCSPPLFHRCRLCFRGRRHGAGRPVIAEQAERRHPGDLRI